MNISYSCNDHYVPQTGISMISLFENNKDVDEITIYLISKDISVENIDVLNGICDRYHRRLIVISFDEIAYDLKLSDTGRHIETIYTKVFYSRIQGLNKVIYLDSDTVVVGPLKDLWDDNLDGYYMAVVETLPTRFYKELGLPKGAPFFNDGMAVCNVEYCRQNSLIEKVLDVVKEFDGTPPTLSEGALNKICFGKIKYISPKYNLMAGLLYLCRLDADYMSSILHYSSTELRDACANPIIIHYLTGFYNRPWFVPCSHPYKDSYFKYKSLSPWKDVQPVYKPLPNNLRRIDWCYRHLGVRHTEVLRRILRGRN